MCKYEKFTITITNGTIKKWLLLWKDTVRAIREKSGWIQCRGAKPLLINLSLSTFRCFEGQATS